MFVCLIYSYKFNFNLRTLNIKMLDRKKPQTVCTESKSTSFLLRKILDQVIMDPNGYKSDIVAKYIDR